jgi:hypothetical protein
VKTVSVTVAARSELLANRDFRLWYLSRSASVAGTAASAVALPLLAYQQTASPGLTAAVVGLEATPYLLFGLFAGAAADRWRRKAMMVGADLGCALLLLTLPVTVALGTLTTWTVLAVAFGIGCGFCWFDAAAWGARRHPAPAPAPGRDQRGPGVPVAPARHPYPEPVRLRPQRGVWWVARPARRARRPGAATDHIGRSHLQRRRSRHP